MLGRGTGTAEGATVEGAACVPSSEGGHTPLIRTRLSGWESAMDSELHLTCAECGKHWRAASPHSECPDCGGRLVESDIEELADADEEDLEGWLSLGGFGGDWPPVL
jgi:hypothetical protein